MILVDSSVWVEHLGRGNQQLAALLEASAVLTHPFVIGEIALGRLRPREETLRMLNRLPQAAVATPEEVQHLIERHRLFGTGIGYVDVHLLASAQLAGGVPLWTHDKHLRRVAEIMGLTRGAPD